MVGFIECESVNISYNIMGIATITYTYIADNDQLVVLNDITIGSVDFSGVVTDVYQQPIPNTENSIAGSWYMTNVTLIAVS